MNLNITFFDVLIVTSLFWIIYEVLFSKSLFNATVLYIIFGLIISIIWVRLDAIDIALAEAALGSGLTGAMFLEAVRHVKGSKRSPQLHFFPSGIVFILMVMFSFLLILALLNASEDFVNIQQMVEKNIDKSGVSQPITAILLNFRGYDTLLEVVVLTITAIGTMALGKTAVSEDKQDVTHKVLSKVVRILIPFIIIVGGYILYLGSSASGGAFQAGAILAALLVLLKLAGIKPYITRKLKNILLILGFSVFLFIAIIFMPSGFSFLEYPLSINWMLIYLIEISLTISIAFILFTLFEMISVSEEITK